MGVGGRQCRIGVICSPIGWANQVFKCEYDEGTGSVTPLLTAEVELPTDPNAQRQWRRRRGPALVYHEVNNFPFPLSNRDKVGAASGLSRRSQAATGRTSPIPNHWSCRVSSRPPVCPLYPRWGWVSRCTCC